jgi:hypothetical protein
MYNHQELILQQKKVEKSLEELLKISEMICSETIQNTILTHLKSLNLAIDAMNANIGTIFLMNQRGKSVHEIFSEYPEEYVPSNPIGSKEVKKLD